MENSNERAVEASGDGGKDKWISIGAHSAARIEKTKKIRKK